MFNMNKQRGAHMGEENEKLPSPKHEKSAQPSKDVKQESGQHHPPHIHIHHSGGKTHVHVLHNDKEDEHHEHEMGDSEGINAHVSKHYGTASGKNEGQDHGEGDGSLDELMGAGV
jgi:hypothetical protein